MDGGMCRYVICSFTLVINELTLFYAILVKTSLLRKAVLHSAVLRQNTLVIVWDRPRVPPPRTVSQPSSWDKE